VRRLAFLSILLGVLLLSQTYGPIKSRRDYIVFPQAARAYYFLMESI